MPVFALYNFNDVDSFAQDSALDNGNQLGAYFNGAAASGGQAVLDGQDDFIKIYPSSEFQLSRGTLDIKFTLSETPVDTLQTVVSRDSVGDTVGGYKINVLADGSVVIVHETATGSETFGTPAGFANPGETVRVTYSWDDSGSGGALQITNTSTSATYTTSVPDTLSMDMGDDNQPWIIGAGQDASLPDQLNDIGPFFAGTVDFMSLSDTVDNVSDVDPDANPDVATTTEDTSVDIPVLANDTDPNGDTLIVTEATATNGTVVINPDYTLTYTPNPDYTGADTITYTVSDPAGNTDTSTVAVTVTPEAGDRDGIVYGTDGDDLINPGYTGDNDGDRVDAYDAILPGDEPNDDRIIAGEGNDTVVAGLGDDSVEGGSGDDELIGQDGNDSLYGGDGNDSANGGDGDDWINTSGPSPLPDQGYPGLYPSDTDPTNDMDTVAGGMGNDTIETGDDADLIYGGFGNDLIGGGFDDDSIYGNDDNDVIVGGEGNDLLDGGQGDDLVYGGYGPGVPDEVNIRDDEGDLLPGNGRDSIIGGMGNDTLFGMDDDDTIEGGQDNDLIDAGIDDDLVYGGAGNDTITGGQGADTLSGNGDRDTFLVNEAGQGIGDVIDGNENGDDYDTLDLRGAGPLRITLSDDNPENGVVDFFDADGNATGQLSFVNIENVIPCFTPGTLIATPKGEVPVEMLREGDKVITRDNGIQEIRWTGRKDMGFHDFLANPWLKPVMIRAGSLGNGLPERDMMVSPNHRVLMANDRTSLYFDEHEVLVSAKHLVAGKGIDAVEAHGTSYIHFMFDRHEVVLSNGAWTESFQPGDYTLRGMGDEQRKEIFQLFPDLKSEAGLDDYQAARRTLKRHEALLLVK